MAKVKRLKVLRLLFCDFCGKSQDECPLLIQGRDGVHICRACIAVCVEMVRDNEHPPKVELPLSVDAVEEA